MEIYFLHELLIVLAVSLVVLFISHKLKLPAVAGFLTTGILIGPSGFSLIKDTLVISVLAEIGVVMLLFTIGLEFSLERLKQIRKIIWVGGCLQVLSTIAAVAVIASLFHASVPEGIFFGFLISLSSTAIVLKVISDREEIDSPQGKVSLGILLFQDLGIVPMIMVIPLLAGGSSASLLTVFSKFSFSILAVGGIVLLAWFLIPRVLFLIVQTKIREAFLITTLLFCLGMAFLTNRFGLSLALGAFIAGIIISESEYSHQVVSDIIPFKDLFNSIFFISVGMLLNLGSALHNIYPIAVLILLIFFGKSLLLFVTIRIMGYITRIAFITALGLAQIGEFSFVVASVGRVHGLLSDDIFQGFIAASIFTMFATPFIIQAAPHIAEISRKVFRSRSQPADQAGAVSRLMKDHVIVAGYGLNGQNLARVLKETTIPFVIIDLDPVTVKDALKMNAPILFGDVSSKEVLNASGIKTAKVIVFAISDPRIIKAAVKISRALNRDIFIIVRTRYVVEIDELYKLGANQVIPEEFETSIEIFTRTLEEYHIPRNIIDAQIKIIRSERYGMLRGISKTARSMEKIMDFLTAGTVETFLVSGGCVAAGKTFHELDLGKETGAIIIAVVRGDKSFTTPPSDFIIRENDILVLVANHQDMDRAFKFLRSEDITT
ncbi:MAG: cation:proton antiporter [Proteobacteria bacterium]|nr:cation:proton antiporter [Pseudomonadota bacterium]